MAITFDRKIFERLTETPQKSAITVAVGSLILIIIMLLVAIRPAVASVVEQVANNKRREELIVLQQNKIDQLKLLVDERNKYTEEIDMLREVFPNFDDVEFIVRNISEYDNQNENIVVESYDIDLQNLSSNQEQIILEGVNSLRMRVDFYADVEQVKQFAAFLDQHPRIMNVSQVNVLYSDEDDGQNEYNLPLRGNISFYYFWQDSPEQ